MTLDDVYEELLVVVSEYGARVDVPIESERFFSRLVASFEGTREELLENVRAKAPEWFRSLAGPPNWIQDAEWQFTESDKPMVFAGEIQIPAESHIFHDDAVVYIFVDTETGDFKTIAQVA